MLAEMPTLAGTGAISNVYLTKQLTGSSPVLMFPLVCTVPVELVQHILSFCHPRDVAAFAQTSCAARALVYHPADQYLWRQLYLSQPFDSPTVISDARQRLGVTQKQDIRDNHRWKIDLIDRLRAERTLARETAPEAERQQALRTLITAIEETSLAIWQTGSSRNTAWVKQLIRQTPNLLSKLYSPLESEFDSESAQLHAQLRSYLNLAIDHRTDKNTHGLLLSRRNHSRAFVYDLRHYNAENNWGPYMPDGSVNWVHIEHLINVISLNIRELPGNWALTRPPSCISIARPFTAPGSSLHPVVDWAGVEGTWRRYVCFMDYRDLFAFNFTDMADGPRHAKFFKDPRFREATRLIEVKLRIVSLDTLKFYRASDLTKIPGKVPPLCFVGSSKGVNGNEATVEGYVTLGMDGIARWYFMSVYDSHPQWSSNGVQIGGLGCSMGVVGIWTTTAHDQDDPVGPFWLWKVEDNSPTHLMEYT